MRPGISTSASSISLRPNSARERSATLKSEDSVAAAGSMVVVNGETPSSDGAHRAARDVRVGPDHRMTARRPDQQSRVADHARRAKLSPVDLEPGSARRRVLDFFLCGPDRLRTHDPRRGGRVPGAPPHHRPLLRGARRRHHRARPPVRTRSTLTVPGGAHLPMAAVAMVTVHPTHRRRGVLRRMMAAQLDDVAQPRRTARRAHRVGGIDLRALRLRHRDVHDELGARVQTTRG